MPLPDKSKGFRKIIKEDRQNYNFLDTTNNLIKEVLNKHQNPVVSCSFGKCSVVMLHLVLQHKPNIKVLFCNTGVEYPETLQFKEFLKKEWNLNLFETTHYKLNFWQCVERFGLPKLKLSRDKTKRSNHCCYYLKEKPATLFYRTHNIDLVFIGIRGEESRQRGLMYLDRKFYYFNKKQNVFKCNPLLDWLETDVNNYISEHNIPINSLYSKVSRTGCMPCTAFLDWKRQLARTNPRLLKIILKKQGQQQLNCKGEIV